MKWKEVILFKQLLSLSARSYIPDFFSPNTVEATDSSEIKD